MARRSILSVPFSDEFLAWQVELRRWTMTERRGAPHAGVAPLVTVTHPGFPLGVTSHSIICGILPSPETLEAKTAEFRELYEANAAAGSRAIYDRGIEYLLDYYSKPDGFDRSSITTLLAADSEIVRALRVEDRCQLVFYVFDLHDRTNVGRLRCLTLHCRAELHESGPVWENVWWHNTLFHGKVDGAVAV